MKNLSLTVKIWLAITIVNLLLYLVVFIITPPLIRNFFTDNLMQPPHGQPKNKIEQHFNKQGFYIQNFILLDDGTTLPSNAWQAFQNSCFNEIKQNAKTQQVTMQLYESQNGQIPIRYVITRDIAYEHPLYQIRFLKKPEEDRFVRDLLFNVMLYLGLALVAGWFVSLFIVRYLTYPLTLMQHHVKRIANRNWHEPLKIKRKDEIGQLAASIDTMRRQLIQQDETQQSMLQNISHELKTPVMVIRSYARAIQDGIYPKGDLTGSIQVIDEEGERLEKLIKQLLYLTRLEYLSTQNPVYESVYLDKLIEKVAQRLEFQRPEINWQLDLHPATIKGDEETLRTMIENLLDNHLRYAVSCLKITLYVNSEKSEVILHFWNDGSHIEPHILNEIFNPFQKGREGKFGLGLAIVQRILKLYQGQIILKNEKNGVSTTIKIPLL